MPPKRWFVIQSLNIRKTGVNISRWRLAAQEVNTGLYISLSTWLSGLQGLMTLKL
jgi:hypothetical protein